MSEQDQTETKSGGGFAGAVAGGATGALSYVGLNNRAKDGVIRSALDGTISADKASVTKAVSEGLAQTTPVTRTNLISATLAKMPENIASIKQVTFTELADKKGYKAEFTSTTGKTSTITGIKSLPKDVKLENGVAKIEGDAVKKLTEGAEKSWVGKIAQTAEKAAVKEIRGSAAFKEAGTVLKHVDWKGKGMVIGVPVLAAVAVGSLAKSTFAGKHTSQVADQRSAETEAAPAR